MTDHQKQGHPPPLQPFNQPGLPQRSRVIELSRIELGNQFAEFDVRTGGRAANPKQVIVEIEILVIDPYRVIES